MQLGPRYDSKLNPRLDVATFILVLLEAFEGTFITFIFQLTQR